MGLFDRFKAGGGAKGEKREDKPKAGAVIKWAATAGDRRAQNYDRLEALQALAELGTADAAAALLRRFTFIIDPSITDQEEKDIAFNGVLRAGKEALEPIRTFVARAESLAWPLKILKELVSEQEYVEEALAWLARWDTEYAKFIDPKLQLLVDLEERRHEGIRSVVEPFLEDVNEPARFHASGAILAQDDEAAAPALLRTLLDEESVRVRTRIVEGFVARRWLVPGDVRDAVRKAVPSGFAVDAQGHVTKR